jgi:hypothetical protein
MMHAATVALLTGAPVRSEEMQTYDDLPPEYRQICATFDRTAKFVRARMQSGQSAAALADELAAARATLERQQLDGVPAFALLERERQLLALACSKPVKTKARHFDEYCMMTLKSVGLVRRQDDGRWIATPKGAAEAKAVRS